MTRLFVCLIALLAATFPAQPGFAQSMRTYNNTNRSAGLQPNAGHGTGLAPSSQNYNYWYLQNQSPSYALSPYVFPPQQRTPQRRVGPAYPYTEQQYGKILEATLGARKELGPRLQQRAGSLLETTTPSLGRTHGTAEAQIIDVADRGVLVADTQEEIRLRGVRIPSEQSTDDVTRYYAREAMRILREMTSDEPVLITFDDPVRDSGGKLLATVHLRDGTSLNRLLLEYGYGQLAPDDFPPDEDPEDLALAQETARTARLGLWSRR